ncbi:MAG: ATP-binding protein [Pseudomonadota bacterium]
MSSVGTLYFLIGKMGAGKSTYSKQLAEVHGAVLISEDDWLAALYPDEIDGLEDFIVRHKRLLGILGPHVAAILSSGSSVVMDFPANTKATREWFLATARAAGAPHQASYLRVADETCLERIARRRIEQPERARYDTPELFEQVTRYFEEPGDGEGLEVIVID